MPYHTPGDINDDTRALDPQPLSPKCRLSSLFGLSPQNIPSNDVFYSSAKATEHSAKYHNNAVYK